MKIAYVNAPMRTFVSFSNCCVKSLIGIAAALALSGQACRAGGPPMFTNLVMSAQKQLQVQLVTVPGESYTIEVSTNLSSWMAVGTFERVETNLLTLGDPEPVGGNGSRFYRVRVGVTPRFGMFFMHSVEAGSFGAASTPAVPYPVLASGYSAAFDVGNDEPYPEAASVRFTGPAGSGLQDTPASNFYSQEAGGFYQSPWVNTPRYATGGEWIVSYRGGNQIFNMADPQTAQRLVIPVPTVTVAGGILQSVSWVYRAPDTGAPVAVRPAYIRWIQVQVQGMGGRLFNSAEITDPAVTTQAVGGVSWSNVTTVVTAYNDSLGNHFVVSFGKP